MKWGIYDTESNLWLGDDRGPKIFCSEQLIKGDQPLGDDGAQIMARIAAEFANRQLGWLPGRAVHRVYEDGPERLVDEVPVKMSMHEALKRFERGAIL